MHWYWVSCSLSLFCKFRSGYPRLPRTWLASVLFSTWPRNRTTSLTSGPGVLGLSFRLNLLPIPTSVVLMYPPWCISLSYPYVSHAVFIYIPHGIYISLKVYISLAVFIYPSMYLYIPRGVYISYQYLYIPAVFRYLPYTCTTHAQLLSRLYGKPL